MQHEDNSGDALEVVAIPELFLEQRYKELKYYYSEPPAMPLEEGAKCPICGMRCGYVRLVSRHPTHVSYACKVVHAQSPAATALAEMTGMRLEDAVILVGSIVRNQVQFEDSISEMEDENDSDVNSPAASSQAKARLH